jgi:hypothetical protein
MNENKIQCALWFELQSSHKLVMPNYTPPNWWENDVMAITNSGYLVEHEIKMSVADFDKDSFKEMDERCSKGWRTGERINKHKLLSIGDTRGPARFYFVVAEGIEHKIELPDWAGLKVAHIHNRRVFTTTIKKAPQLHKQKVDPTLITQALSTCYYRMWSYKKKIA